MTRTSLLLLLVAATAMAQSRPNHPPQVSGPVRTNPAAPKIGDPLPGLSVTELMEFTVGQAQFKVVDGPEDGLGPIFNAQSCFACHTQPASASPATTGVVANPQTTTPGGASTFTETRAGRTNPDGSFNPLTNEDGTLFKLSSLTPASQEIVPADATIVAHRKTTPLFGLGLIEAIPDAEILANARRNPGDGVKGVPAILNDAVTNQIAAGHIGPANHVGRFGWKAQESTLLAFAGDAYLNEMGITNRFFGTDLAPDGNQAILIAAEPKGFSLQTPNAPLTQLTPTTLQDLPENPALPESPTNRDDIAEFAIFMEFLANPPTVPLTAQAQQGKQIFANINCVACHTPSMQTGPSNVSPALAFKPVPLYSDLLLHNMGTLNDNIAQAAAGPNQTKTPALWGLRFRGPFLHDGRASTLSTAILLHDGEAKPARDRFANLPSAQQQAIYAFLNSI